MTVTLLHPVLGVPYGTWIVIAEQRSLTPWFDHFDPDKIALFEALEAQGQCWILLRRGNPHNCDLDNPTLWARVAWLKTPPVQRAY